MYISYPVEVNPFTLVQRAYDYIKSRVPGWLENNGNLDTWIIQIFATAAADIAELAQTVADTIWRAFGSTIMGLDPVDATYARVDATFTAIDTKGHTIPAGTVVAIPDAVGVERAFLVQADYVIPTGQAGTPDGFVGLVALDPGAASSAIGAPGQEITVVGGLDWVDTVTIENATSGGIDAETTDEYNDRLATYMRTLSTRPILAEDFTNLTLVMFPEAYRVLTLDEYNPADDTWGNPKMVTITGTDIAGLDLDGDLWTEIEAWMEDNREINFIVNTMDPIRTDIDVTFTAKANPGVDLPSTEAAATAAVIEYLSAANWGIDKTAQGRDRNRTWVDESIVRRNEIMVVIGNVPGIDYVETLTLAAAGDALGVLDISLDGPATLTGPGIIDGTVT